MNQIIRSYLTEKSALSIDQGLYVFIVSPKATKPEITKEIKVLYGIEPKSVRVTTTKPKNVRFKRRKGVRAAIKKAYVQLQPKDSLPGFEVLKETKEKQEKELVKNQVAQENQKGDR